MTKGTPTSSQIICLEQMVERQAARIAELTAALKPFADLADEWRVTEGDERFYIEANVFPDDLRAARAAYLGEKNE